VAGYKDTREVCDFSGSVPPFNIFNLGTDFILFLLGQKKPRESLFQNGSG